MWFRRIFSARTPAAASRRGSGRPKPATATQAVTLSPTTLRLLNRLQLVTRRAVPGLGAGERASHWRQPAPDFREHRQYVPGDDVRFVDWRASARQEHVFIKQGEQLKNVLVTLLLDCSASMAWGEPPKSRTAIELAAALGYLALAHGDRLVVLPVVDTSAGERLPAFGPASGKGQFPALLSYLRLLRFSGRVDLGPALAGLSRRGRSGGLVLAISDFLGTAQLEASLAALAGPNWNVGLLHLLHPAELNPVLRGDFELVDIETRQVRRYSITESALKNYHAHLAAWRDGLERTCQTGIRSYTLVPTGGSLAGQILPALRAARVVQPL